MADFRAGLAGIRLSVPFLGGKDSGDKKVVVTGSQPRPINHELPRDAALRDINVGRLTGVAATLFGPGPRSAVHESFTADGPFPVRGRVVKDDGRQARIDTASHALTPIRQAGDWMKFEDLITVEVVGANTLVIKAKNRPENPEQFESWSKTFATVARTAFYNKAFGKLARSLPEEEAGAVADYITALCGADMVSEAGLKITIQGIENLDPKKGYILAPTHGSMVQILTYFLIVRALGMKTRFVLKQDLMKGAFAHVVGEVIKHAKGFCPLTRDDEEADDRLLSEHAAWLNAHPGTSTVIFPEGTRHDMRVGPDGKRMPGDPLAKRGGLSSGASKLALLSGLEIVPIVDDTCVVLAEQNGKPALINGEIRIVIGKPIDPNSLDNETPLEKRVAMLTRETLAAYRDVYDHWQIPMMTPEEAGARRTEFKREKSLQLLGKARGPIGDKTVNPDKARVLKSLKTLQALATLPRDAAKNPKAANAERRALNNFLDHFYPAVALKEQGRVTDLNLWLKKNDITPEWFDVLYKWMDQHNELSSMKKRHAKTWREQAVGVLDKLAPGTVHTREEQILTLMTHLGEGARILGATVPDVAARLNQAGLIKVSSQDGTATHAAKMLARLVGRRWGKPEDTAKSQVSGPVVADNVTRLPGDEKFVRDLTRVAELPEFTTLSDTMRARIAESYGFNLEIQARMEALIIDYFNFMREISERALAIASEERTFDDHEVNQAWEGVEASFRRATLNDKPMTWPTFEMMLGLHDASRLFNSPSSARAEFEELMRAERALGALTKNPDATPEELSAARRDVIHAHNEYALKAGISAGSETFEFFENTGLIFSPQTLKVLFQNAGLSEAYGTREIFAAHARLHEPFEPDMRLSNKERENLEIQYYAGYYDKEKQFIPGRDSLFKSAVRRFLDQPGNSRALQTALVQYHFAYEALGKDPAGLMAAVFAHASRGQKLGPEELAYQDALRRYQTHKDKAGLGKLEKAVMTLLKSDAGTNLVFSVASYLDNPQTRIDMSDAYTHSQEYWQERRWLADKVRAEEDRLRPARDEFDAWYFERENQIVADNDELNLRAAETMRVLANQTLFDVPFRNRLRVYKFTRSYADAVTLARKAKARLEKATEDLSNHRADVIAGKTTKMLDKAGHGVHYNRANEARGAAVQQAFHTAARQLGETTNTTPRQPIDLLRVGMSGKTTPVLDKDKQRELAKNLFEYMGPHVGAVLVEVMFNLENNHPMADVDAALVEAARNLNQNFHLVEVIDKSAAHQQRGTHIADVMHTGGWFFDYGLGLWISPEGRRYLMVAKPGLDKIIPGPMAPLVDVVGDPLPEAHYQPLMEAQIARGILYGGLGMRDYLMFGGLSIPTLNLPQFGALSDPNALMSPDRLTGHDLRDIGRQQAAVMMVAAARGSMSGITPKVIAINGAHGVSLKPDAVLRVEPAKEAQVTIVGVEPLVWSNGTGLNGSFRQRAATMNNSTKTREALAYLVDGAV